MDVICLDAETTEPRQAVILNFFGLAIDAALISLEASHVVAMRCERILAGGAAGQAELELMVAEKIAAFSHAGQSLLLGVPLARVNANLRAVMNANRVRLAEAESR